MRLKDYAFVPKEYVSLTGAPGLRWPREIAKELDEHDLKKASYAVSFEGAQDWLRIRSALLLELERSQQVWGEGDLANRMTRPGFKPWAAETAPDLSKRIIPNGKAPTDGRSKQ